jgi:hypothetical protein
LKPEATISPVKYFDSILPARFDWPSAIGNFLLNFGTLEYFVFVFLKDRLTVDEFAKIREWHLKDRLKRVAQFVAKNGSKEKQSEFTLLMDRIEELRELRNHIAHGHMLCRIDVDTQKPVVTIFKARDVDMAHSSEAKHLELNELRTALNTLTQVIDEFQHLAGFEPR